MAHREIATLASLVQPAYSLEFFLQVFIFPAIF
jgi:hypothetical protein